MGVAARIFLQKGTYGGCVRTDIGAAASECIKVLWQQVVGRTVWGIASVKIELVKVIIADGEAGKNVAQAVAGESCHPVAVVIFKQQLLASRDTQQAECQVLPKGPTDELTQQFFFYGIV